MTVFNAFEATRQDLQNKLDAAKTLQERNKLGQYSTPIKLASDIVEYAKTLLPASAKVKFLDPAFGTGAFYSALINTFSPKRIVKAEGYEIDRHYADDAAKLWADTTLRLHIKDFTKAQQPKIDEDKFNLVICNPPYVRHQHLTTEDKKRLQNLVREKALVNLSGLSGLYCYFLCIADAWLANKGLSGWLIPSEFMDVNYGKEVKNYLLRRVTLLRIHRFDPNDVQFNDALVSSAVVWFKKELPPANHTVEFTFGGTLERPSVTKHIPWSALAQIPKWTSLPLIEQVPVADRRGAKLSDLFSIKRGLATGANDYFVLTREQAKEHDLPSKFLTPILPSPRYLKTDEISASGNGEPMLETYFYLVNCNIPEDEVRARYPALCRYFNSGVEQGISKRYLCSGRSPWYLQEIRPPAPLLCTYMGRRDTKSGRPFRFIRNRSNATAANVYLMMYPKPLLERAMEHNPNLLDTIWQHLNQVSYETMTGEGRVYGGGLHKMEPKELGNVPIEFLNLQNRLFD